jgi:Family of unknown function (DUF6159)
LVGLLIEQIASRLPAGGSIVARIAGYGWSLASLFAIPILALDDCSPVDCLKRSAGLVKERWGEGIAGGIIITARKNDRDPAARRGSRRGHPRRGQHRNEPRC